MQSGSKKQVDVARLKNDLRSATIELLSAQCATDRIRLHYSPEDLAAFGERSDLNKAIASAGVLHRYFSWIEAHLRHADRSSS